MTHRVLLLALLFILCGGVYAQQPLRVAPRPMASSASPTDAEQARQKRQLMVFRVEGFADQLLSFQDPVVKGLAIARLADLLWKDDEKYARQLFHKAIGLTTVRAGATAEELRTLFELRREIIAIIARRDANLAKSLTDADNDADAAQRMETNFVTAYDLLGSQPEKSIEFAELSLRDGVFPYMRALLAQLRRTNEPAANALFLKALARLVTQPEVDALDLLYLGTYIFTSPKLNPSDPTVPANAVIQIGVGNLLVYDITADRPGIPRALIRAYLEAAVRILTRRVWDEQQRQLYYVAAYLLLPKAEKFAPDLVAPIGAAMSALASNIPPELTQRSAYAKLEAAPQQDLDETLQEIERLPNERHRNERYLSLTFTLWNRGDFAKARTVAGNITELPVRSQLETLIDFGEACRTLESGETDLFEVEKVAGKLPKGIERALLWLGLARAQAKAKNNARAAQAINESLAAARDVADARRPSLMLIAAAQLSSLDTSLAQSTLADAVKQFNAQKATSMADYWYQRIETGYVGLDFPLRVRGVEYGFDLSLAPLVSADLEDSLLTINQLASEEQRGQSLLVCAAVMLK